MALAAGTRLGAYEITSELGAGGMGEVYRALDTSLKRDVAIKVLPASLATDAERLARFQREAEVLAALNHPNIAQIYGTERGDGTTALVMELVEGPTLAERIARGPIAVDDALAIATQIADALEAAHERGIVHRDLKPENVKLRPDGTVKVLDFGIAKAFDTRPTGPNAAALTTPAMTAAGIVLGTAAYMSPEQARGRPVDQRADIWAFGCVLYEMLTGQLAFGGEDVTVVLARVLERGADFDALPAGVVPGVRRALELCLEKDPRRRIRHIGDVKLALERRFETPPDDSSVAAAAAAARGFWRKAAPLAAGAAVLAGVAVWLGFAYAPKSQSTRAAAPAAVVRFGIPVGKDDKTYLGGSVDSRWERPSSTSLAISADGKLLAYAAWKRSGDAHMSQLYLRRLDRDRADAIAGTEEGAGPFFSPDDAWVGFFAGKSLKRLAVASGRVETIVPDAKLPSTGPRGAAWGDDGRIVYAGDDGLYRVSASGGTPELIAKPGSAGGRLAQPYFLPGSRTLLFHEMTATQDPALAQIFALDLKDQSRKPLLADAMDPRYVAATHELLFMRRGTLLAAAFDAQRVELEGEPFVALDDVMQAVGMTNGRWETGAAELAVSAAGHLVYASGGVFPVRKRALLGVGADGRDWQSIGPQDLAYGRVRASPDGKRLATEVVRGRGAALYVYDLETGVNRRLDVGAFNSSHPVWSPDGRSIALTADLEDGVLNLYRVAADGSTAPKRLAPSTSYQFPSSWSSLGAIAYVQFASADSAGAAGIWVLPPDGKAAGFVATGSDPAFSPDGRWLAYSSDESGRSDVYVRPYPGPGAATQISADGGQDPAWSPQGDRIYFLAPPAGSQTYNGNNANRLMAVDVLSTAPLRVGRARSSIDPWLGFANNPTRGYDVLPNGGFVTPAYADSVERRGREQALDDGDRGYATRELHVVLNFVDELRRRGVGRPSATGDK